MQVQSLPQKDPLEKKIATHFSILAWEIHGQRRLAGYRPWGDKRVRYDWRMSMYLSLIKQKMKEKNDILDFVFLLKIKTGVSIWSCTCLCGSCVCPG